MSVWVCLVPLGLSLYRSEAKHGLVSGFVCGFCFWFSAVWWLKINLVGLVGLPPWQAWGWTVIFCAYHAVLKFSRQAALNYPKAELMAFPELPCGYSCTADEAGKDMPLLVKDTGMAVMISCAAVADPKGPFYYNSVVFMDKRGLKGETYHKNILVPFGEYIPLERHFPFLRRLFPGVMPFVPGEKAVLYDLGKGRQGIPSLCYEAIFSGYDQRQL